MSGGLIIDGALVEVAGVEVLTAADDPKISLDRRDYRARPTRWLRQIIQHTTKGIWPQKITHGPGRHGRVRSVADFWRGDPKQSAAPIIVGSDGVGGCLADLVKIEAYHAELSNPWSVGIETYQEADGSISDVAIASTIAIAKVVAIKLGIQWQIPKGYSGHPLARMLNGGPLMVGVFGHRDNTESRGRGDPGLVLDAYADAGAEIFDYAAGEDLIAWKERQAWLVRKGHKIQIDGVPGPATRAALIAEGYPGGVWALAPVTR